MNFTNGEMSIELVLIGIFLGITIAIIVNLYRRSVPGEFINRLRSFDATNPENAANLYKLGYKTKPTLTILALRKGSTLRKLVYTYEEQQNSNNQITIKSNDITKLHFYIPCENSDKINALYPKKKANIFISLLLIVIIGMALLGLYAILPEIIKLIENFISIVTK